VAALVRSHVVPRAFFDLADKDRVTLLSNTPGEYPKRSPIGVYDFILCEACEGSLGAFDDYAIKVLKQQLPDHERIERSGKLGAILIRGVDYRLLKLFAISCYGALRWRNMCSTRA
jgi:hypothetical protein